MNSTSRDVPDVILEQYRLRELPAAEAARVERLVREDPALARRLAALDESDREIEREYPWLAERIAGCVSEKPRLRLRRGRRLALVVSTIAAVMLVVLARPWGSDGPAPADRIKGLKPALMVYRHTPNGSETLADGAPARTGDVLRVGYIAAGRSFGAILSIDGRGIVTRHLPVRGARAAALHSGGPILLDAAYELDDAPAWERFYLVTADHDFDVDAVIDVARRAASRDVSAPPAVLPLPGGLDQVTFSVQKR